MQSTSTSLTLSLGWNTLYAYICNSPSPCNEQTIGVYYMAGRAPIVSLAPHSPDIADYARCANACFAATYAQGTVPYYSMNTPRSVTLAYNGDQVDPKPFLHVDVTHGGNSGNLPSYFYLKAKGPSGTWIRFLNGETELHFSAAAGAAFRMGGEFRADSNSMANTGSYAITVIVGASYTAGTVEDTLSTRVIVVNETNSPIARGWTVAGVQRAYIQSDGLLITEGTGSATFYAKPGSTFATPTGDFARVTASGSGTGTTYTRAYPDSTKVTFNYLGYMTQLVDRFGNADSVFYDSNHITSIKDPTHITPSFSYDTNGLQWISDPLGRVTYVTVQSNHTLTAITDPDTVATTFGYDNSLRLSTITDRRGATTTLTYESHSDKLAAVTAPAVPILGSGTSSPVTNLAPWQLGAVPYSSTTSTPASAARADTVYAAATDPGGHVAQATVNGFGQTLRATGPLGDTVTVTYNTAGQPTQVVDRLGVTSSYTYDATTGVVTSSTVGGLTSYVHYGVFAQPDSTWGDGQPRRRMYLNAANGRVDSLAVRVDASTLSKTRFLYDGHGRVTQATDHLGHLLQHTTYGGTLDNRLVDSLPGGHVTTYAYDAFGRDSIVARSGMPSRTSRYDRANRLTQVYDGVNATPIQIAYDSLQLRSVTDQMGQAYRFGYNALGWLATRTDPAGHADSLFYDADGLLRRIINRSHDTVDVSYDALHRQYVRSGTHITSDTTTYSGDAHRVVTSNAAASDTVYLNARLVPDSIHTRLTIPGSGSQAYWRRYWYHTNGLRDSLTASGGGLTFVRRSYAYNPWLFMVDSVQLGSGNWTVFGRNDDLQVTTTRFPGQDSITAGLLTTHADGTMLSAAIDDTLGYDSLGRIQRHLISGGARRGFGYDGLGRMDTVAYYSSSIGGSWSINFGWLFPGSGLPSGADSVATYTYDRSGNTLSRSSATGGIFQWGLSGAYDTTRGNRIRSFGGTTAWMQSSDCTYATDSLGVGNVIQRTCSGTLVPPSATFGWDADGHLISVALASGPTIAYLYNAAGQLVRRDSAGSSTFFLWNGDNLFAELGASGTTKRAEFDYFGTDRPHAIIIGSTPYYAHVDAIGNVRGLTNGGTVYRSYAYDEWGHHLAGAAPASGFDGADRPRFKGALWMAPEADLYYMRNRWYEPWTGRFLSEDPVGLDGGINPYTFAGADPVNGGDPTGLVYCYLEHYVTHQTLDVAGKRNREDNFDNWRWVCEFSSDGGQDGGAQGPSDPAPGSGGTVGGRGGVQPVRPPLEARVARCLLSGVVLLGDVIYTGAVVAGGLEIAGGLGAGIAVGGTLSLFGMGTADISAVAIRLIDRGAKHAFAGAMIGKGTGSVFVASALLDWHLGWDSLKGFIPGYSVPGDVSRVRSACSGH
jgi:RHS repeat-associated protein